MGKYLGASATAKYVREVANEHFIFLSRKRDSNSSKITLNDSMRRNNKKESMKTKFIGTSNSCSKYCYEASNF